MLSAIFSWNASYQCHSYACISHLLRNSKQITKHCFKYTLIYPMFCFYFPSPFFPQPETSFFSCFLSMFNLIWLLIIFRDCFFRYILNGKCKSFNLEKKYWIIEFYASTTRDAYWQVESFANEGKMPNKFSNKSLNFSLKNNTFTLCQCV